MRPRCLIPILLVIVCICSGVAGAEVSVSFWGNAGIVEIRDNKIGNGVYFTFSSGLAKFGREQKGQYVVGGGYTLINGITPWAGIANSSHTYPKLFTEERSKWVMVDGEIIELIETIEVERNVTDGRSKFTFGVMYSRELTRNVVFSGNIGKYVNGVGWDVRARYTFGSFEAAAQYVSAPDMDYTGPMLGVGINW